MMAYSGRSYIVALQRRWMILRLLTVLFSSMAIALAAGWLLRAVFAVPSGLELLIFLLAFAAIAWIAPFWKLPLAAVASHLDQQYPALEESASLLLREEQELSLLERLQLAKVHAALPEKHSPKVLLHRLAYAFSALLIVALIGHFIKLDSLKGSPQDAASPAAAGVLKPVEKVPTSIKGLKLSITPPSYTGLQARAQTTLSLKVEDGAKVSWNVQTSAPVKQMKVLFNDQVQLSVPAADPSGTRWTFQRTISHSGFYQLIVDGVKSDLYEIEIIPDLPVRIKVLQPRQNTAIDYGQRPVVQLQASLSDEYGIKSATIAATLASGKGESVSFSDKNIPLVKPVNGQKQVSFTQHIDLRTLGMKPGDELYFYIKAVDNKNQGSRSDVFFVSMVDTAELMSMNGMVSGVNLVPEYFRSQRQIIIDTEKLIKEQGSISEADFKNRSNNLGLDQKLLRLRYGKFLGEESENEIGPGEDHDHEEDHEHQRAEDKTKALMESFSHLHDVAEDATYFEPELKAQLKAVLTEMWKAELQLRTFKLQDALPFEYKALRLLKDLQQKSRAYVAKTTVKAPQLKEEKRLSGELDKIMAPLQTAAFEKASPRERMLKQALGILELYKSGYALKTKSLLLLKEVEKEMIVAAGDYPSTFLPALKRLRKLAGEGQATDKDVDLMSHAIGRLMVEEKPLPQQPAAAASSTLYKAYFKHLNQLKP